MQDVSSRGVGSKLAAVGCAAAIAAACALSAMQASVAHADEGAAGIDTISRATYVSGGAGTVYVDGEEQGTVNSNPKALQGEFDAISSATRWEMPDQFIVDTGNATVPTTLGYVTYNKIDNWGIIGEDALSPRYTLTVPAGATVGFRNIKFGSSVKIVVEKGAYLCLEDCVAFGPIEVNGGTIKLMDTSSVTDVITLNDGSTIVDSDFVSHANYLTDRQLRSDEVVDAVDNPEKYHVDDPEVVVVVNGTVTAKGANSITGDKGAGLDADHPYAQHAVQVNGMLVIPQGSELTAQGGGDTGFAPRGGTGIMLNGGTVTGAGTLNAKGGLGYGTRGGDGVGGKGTVSVKALNAEGGIATNGYLALEEGEAGLPVADGVTVKDYAETQAAPEAKQSLPLKAFSVTAAPSSANNGKATTPSKSSGVKTASSAAAVTAASAPSAGESTVTVGTKFTKVGKGAAKASYVVNNAKKRTVTYVSSNVGKKAKKAVVPATVTYQGKTYKVTQVGSKAFKSAKKVKTVTLGKNVTKVHKKAFAKSKVTKVLNNSSKLKDAKLQKLAGSKITVK